MHECGCVPSPFPAVQSLPSSERNRKFGVMSTMYVITTRFGRTALHPEATDFGHHTVKLFC